MFKRERHNKTNVPFNALMIILAFALTVFAVLAGGYIQEGLSISVDSISDRRIKAPKEVVNEVGTERLRQQARNSVSPLYKHDPEVSSEVIENLEKFFSYVDNERMKNLPIITPYNNNNETVPVDEVFTPTPTIVPEGFDIHLTERQAQSILDADTKTYNEFKQRVREITDAALEIGIKNEGVEKSLVSVKDEIDSLEWNATTKSLANAVVAGVLAPNLIIDEEATEREREEKAREVIPLVYKAGQTIVDDGEIITEDIFSALDSLGYVSRGLEERIMPLAGCLVFVTIAFVCALYYIQQFHKSIIKQKKEALIIFTLYVIVVLAAMFMVNLPFYFIPILVFAMLVAILIEPRLSVVLTIFVTLITGFIYKGDLSFYIYFIINSTLLALISKYTTRRNKIFSVGVIISLSSALTVYASVLLFDRVLYSREMLDSIAFSVLAGLFSVILSIGSLPFWEAVFGVITSIKLLDLTNPNNPLIRRLVLEAPGTYHHSLVVANLAETASYDVGANPSLARVGAYYHDIGKLKYPGYFAENQMGENPHDFMDPYSSAQVIIGHTTYGEELADENKLPPAIKEIVGQHHGNTLVKYFYHRAAKAGPVNEADFRYKNKTPQSRESAIVMLADTVEAAIRSLSTEDRKKDKMEELTRILIKDKLDDNQLKDSMLTIKDLETIKASFMRVFTGMYHERIVYPKPTTIEIVADANAGREEKPIIDDEEKK